MGDYVGVVPFAGMTVSKYYGTSDHNSSNDYKNASAAAGLAGVKVWAKVSRHFFVSLNAGYEFSVYKSKTCKVICDQVDDFKKWTEGPSLGVSLMVVL